jgi:hypothetical protein
MAEAAVPVGAVVVTEEVVALEGAAVAAVAAAVPLAVGLEEAVLPAGTLPEAPREAARA